MSERARIEVETQSKIIVEINPETSVVVVDGRIKVFGDKELEVLQLLNSERRFFPREEIHEKVWNDTSKTTSAGGVINKIRDKIGKSKGYEETIINKKGAGYLLNWKVVDIQIESSDNQNEN